MLQCFSSERALQEHRAICLEINDKQSVNLESDSIKFKKYFKQTALLFKIYTDAKYILVKIHINDKDKKTSYTGKHHIPFRFACTLVVIDDKFSKPVVLYRGKDAIQN